MLRRLVTMAVAAGAVIPLSAAAAGGGRVTEQIVAVIRSPALAQTRVLTLTRLEEEGRIALVSRGAVAAAARPLDGAALRAALEWLIDQMVLSDEVNRLQVFEVDRAEVLGERDRFRARFAHPEDYSAFLGRLEMNEEDLLVVLRRMARVQHYLESRVHPGRIRDAEVEAYWRDHAAELEGRDAVAARELIRGHLVAQQAKAEVRALLVELRGRHQIRVLTRFDGEE